MNTTELIARVREVAFIDTNSVDYTDARICREMTDVLRSIFSAMVVKSKGSYWLRTETITTTAGQPQYRMPTRACAGGINRIQIAYTSSENYEPLPELDEEQALNYELGVGQRDAPQRFVLRGDRIVLFPSPDAAYKLRVFYYLEPPQLCPVQATSNGLVTSVNYGTRTFGCSTAVQSFSGLTLTPATLTTGSRAEMVRTTGWCEVVAPSETVTVSGSSYTFGGTTDQSLAQVGDYVVAEGQSFWPPLPEEYQRTLADMTAAEICRQRRFFDAQHEIEANAGGALIRFKEHIQPRVQQGHRTISVPNVYTSSGGPRRRYTP